MRNAVYKVIRARDAASLGRRVVVQGGTFMNDAVLRAFENLYGAEVARPALAAHMGAYGAALIARDRAAAGGRSGLLSQAHGGVRPVRQRLPPDGDVVRRRRRGAHVHGG